MRLFLTSLALGLTLGLGSALAQPVALTGRLITDALDQPVYATAPPADPRLFVVEQTGRIRIIVDGKLTDTAFLDLSGSISSGGEQGLLGLAFHPGYADNGRFFVNYTDKDGDTHIVGYKVSADPAVADPASATELLRVDQPYANHNGGWLGFGPDGYLYIGMGDGGSGGDPENRAQNPDELLGKILRLDVDGAAPYAIPANNPFAEGGGRPEIFALGVRNPWRPSFDSDDFYVADVGQNAHEEVTVITAESAGANLGWKIMEGPACYEAESCEQTGLVPPSYSYSHDTGGCSITGGYVYRGKAIPEISGQYFFADFCDSRVNSFAFADGEAGDLFDWTQQLGGIGGITSFGLDSSGELYITTIEGKLFEVVRAE